MLVVIAVDRLLEVKLLDRIGLGAISGTTKKARHGEREITAVLRRAERAPCGVVGRVEQLGEIARIGQLLPALHPEQPRRGAGDERRVARGPDLAETLHDLEVGRAVIEAVVADERPVGLAAQLAEFRFVDLLEQRALVPSRIAELAEGLAALFLGDVEDSDLEILTRRRVHHHVVEATPRRFQPLELGIVDDQVDLFRQLAVDRRAHRVHGREDIVSDDRGIGQRLLGERLHRFFDTTLASVVVGLELLLEESRKVVERKCLRFGLLALFLYASHDVPFPSPGL